MASHGMALHVTTPRRTLTKGLGLLLLLRLLAGVAWRLHGMLMRDAWCACHMIVFTLCLWAHPTMLRIADLAFSNWALMKQPH